MSTLIQITDIEKAYGSQELFQKTSLVVNKGQKIGIIGRNGAGKSTLFKLITGQEELDGGEINIYPQTRIGYLEQQDPFTPQEKVIDFLVRYSKRESWECGKVAAEFQLKTKELNSSIKDLAGGYQMRVKITAMLLAHPNLLLLDEPTNFLDLSTLLALEQFLDNHKGTHLIISHDREFLKRTCTETLDVEHGKLFLHPQGIENYLAYRESNLKMKLKHNKNIELKQKHLQRFVDRFRAKASKASQAQSKIKQLERLKPIEIEHSLARVRIYLPQIEQKKGPVLHIKEMAIGYPGKEVAKNISITIDHGERIAIVGDNGQGKTTLLKTLVNELPVLAGNFHFVANTRIGYYAQHVPQKLDPEKTVYDYLHQVSASDILREEILKMAGNFLFRDDALKKKIKVLSGGEKARLCLAGLLLQKDNCLFLDEPSNHLDFETVEALASALQNYNGTVLFISHNRTFVHLVATGVVEVKDQRVVRYPGNYDDYVWMLKQNMLQEREKGKNNEEVIFIVKKSSQNNYQEIKLLKKKLGQVEKKMEKYEKEKDELNDWFEKHPTEYHEEKYFRVQIVANELESLEKEWLAIQEKLEG
jgi:ATP-binding cassette subfamily F protein 3